MENVVPALPIRSTPSVWRDVVLPKEHGSWSLAFEPIVLALLVAPTAPGGLLAVALAAGFFARRPLRLARVERKPQRRAAAARALAACGAVSCLALAGAVVIAGVNWLPWLAPMAALGAAFLWFDARGEGREGIAEALGAAAFALAPAAFATLAGWMAAEALALALIVAGRSVPSVMMVRAYLRGAKTAVRRDGPALMAAAIAAAMAAVLCVRGWVPVTAAAVITALALRAAAFLVVLRPGWRARTVGMIEGAVGVLFVAAMATAWLL